MARNLFKKKKPEEAGDESVPVPPKEDSAEAKPVTLVTMDQLILSRLDNLNAMVYEGFNQLGVDFEKKKEEHKED